MIDKFTKYAMIEEIPDRSTLTLIKAYLKLFILMKKPKQIILDNEKGFRSPLFTDFLEKQNIQYHFTTPNRHTGNSDIERFHGSMNEQIRILKIREIENDINLNIDLPVQALSNYNNLLHLTTGKKPIDLHFSNKINLQEIFKRMEDKKRKICEYRNRDRVDKKINSNYVKTYKNKLDQKVKKVNVKKTDNKKYTNNNQEFHKDQFIKQKKYISRSLEVLIDPIDDQPSCSTKAVNNRS